MYSTHSAIQDNFMSSKHKTLSSYMPLNSARCDFIGKTTQFMLMVCELLPQMYKYFSPHLICPCTPPYISKKHSYPIKRLCSITLCYPTVWVVAMYPGTCLVDTEYWPQIFHLFSLLFSNSIYFHSHISNMWDVILKSTIFPLSM